MDNRQNKIIAIEVPIYAGSSSGGRSRPPARIRGKGPLGGFRQVRWIAQRGADGPPATLGSSTAAGVRLIVWCRDCRHQAFRGPARLDATRQLNCLTFAASDLAQWPRLKMDRSPSRFFYSRAMIEGSLAPRTTKISVPRLLSVSPEGMIRIS
jgi:hypothetical protein